MNRMEKIAESMVAVKMDTRKEVQKYKQEHDARPGTRVQVRNKQEMKKRYHDKASAVVDRIASKMTAGFMGMVYALKKVGEVDTEMMLDITNGFMQVGMGGEWWNGVVKPGKTILHHKKEHVDPAYLPVEVTIANRGYEVHVAITGGFYGETFDFVIAAR